MELYAKLTTNEELLKLQLCLLCVCDGVTAWDNNNGELWILTDFIKLQ